MSSSINYVNCEFYDDSTGMCAVENEKCQYNPHPNINIESCGYRKYWLKTTGKVISKTTSDGIEKKLD